LAIPTILQQLITKDMTDEDADKYIKSLPDYVKNGQVLLIPGKHGMNALDVSYMVPWGNWWQMSMNMKEGKLTEAMKDIGIGGGIIPSVLYTLKTNKDLFTGEDVITPMGLRDKKLMAREITQYIWNQAMPPMVSNYGAFGKMKEHIQHGKTKAGLPTEGMNVYPRIAGINIYPVNPKAKKISIYHDIKAVRDELRKKMYDRTLTDEEKAEIRMIYKFSVDQIKEE
jgi:hypothetical protein